MKEANESYVYLSEISGMSSCRLGSRPGSSPTSSVCSAQESSHARARQTRSVFTPINGRRSPCHAAPSTAPFCHSVDISFPSKSSVSSFTQDRTGMSDLQICSAESICQSNGPQMTRIMNPACLSPTSCVECFEITETPSCLNITFAMGSLSTSVALVRSDRCGNAKAI